MLRKSILVLVPLTLASLLLYTGCSRPPTEPTPPSPSTPSPAVESKHVEDHGHKPGKHGGLIWPIGRDNYHAEAVAEGGTLRLHLLGKDVTRVQEVPRQTLTAYAKPAGAEQPTEFALEPEPLGDDSPGQTSRFAGPLPMELRGKELEVTIRIRIADERYRFVVRLPDEKDQKLFLTPGGKYTAADVQANGNVTPAQKFQGFTADHNKKPQAGAKICPISDTEANPKCTWIVAGKTYEFCCPPCIGDFVRLAKEKPDQIKEPADYRK